jgi:hypothetical protein
MKQNLSVKIPEELKDWLYEWAENNGVKVSDTIILLIEYLKNMEENYQL